MKKHGPPPIPRETERTDSMSIFGWSTYDEWKTTEPPRDDDIRDYCPECEHIWAKCKCEPDDDGSEMFEEGESF